MTFIFLCMLTGALIIGWVKKYVLRIKEPTAEELWVELDEQDWYKTLLKKGEIEEFILLSKRDGLLSDPHYVRNIIDKEGHREGFINYINEKIK
ncbi:hypothetical protein ACFSO7_13035 [Bacillus sp. CGMCC 1.16607]|uniref:hypothetical protein n=1 Tax=Bacillus sp. CGMCC 1.16607 TaxID=3351842 RepID=UPI00362AC335